MTVASSELGVACVQLTPERQQAQRNLEHSVSLIHEAADQGYELIILPELTNSGYAFQSKTEAFEAAETLPDGPTCRAWREAARQCGVWIVGGLAERAGIDLYDSAILLDPEGDLLSVYRKVHLWSTEHLWFEPGRRPSDVVPLPFGRLAIAICFDLWVPEQFRYYARQGADIVCVPSNWSSPAVVEGGDRPIVDYLAISAAHVNAIYIAGADRAGSDGAFQFLGASMIVNPRGEVVARAELSAPETAIVGARLDLMESRIRKTWSRFDSALDVDPALFNPPLASGGAEHARDVKAIDDPRTRASSPKFQQARSRVIEQALPLFQSQGYPATSIRQVAETAGLAKATVYHYYPTKSALLYEIHNIFMETLEEGMERIQRSEATPDGRIRAIVRELWRVMVTHRAHVQIFFEEWRHLDKEDIAGLKERRDNYYRFVRDAVAEGWPGAASRGEEHIDVITLGIFGMCNWGYQWFDPKGPLPADVIADDYADFVMAGLSAQGGQL